MGEDDEHQIKINSKKKLIDNAKPTLVKNGFVPTFSNKNKIDPEEDNGINTITKMFKNAPPPREKPKRTVDDISGTEDPPHKVLTKKRKLEELNQYKFMNKSTENTKVVEPDIFAKNT